MTDRRAYWLLSLVLLVWAGNYPFSKLGLREIGPLTLTGSRALIAAPLLWAIARVSAPLGRGLALGDWRTFALLGLSGLVGNTTVWCYGLARTSTLNAGIIGATTPIFVGLSSWLLLRDRLTFGNWLGIGLSVLAVLVTVAKGSLTVMLDLAVNSGDLIILASQVSWVTYSLLSRGSRSTLSPAWIMAGAHAVAGAVLVPLALVIERPWATLGAAPLGVLAVLYGVVPVTVGHLLYYQVVRAIGPARAATFLNLMPFVVLALSWVIVGEPVHAYHLAGAALVIGGVYLATARAGAPRVT
jgi:drug/metabolite transporter (DMT)-like permease